MTSKIIFCPKCNGPIRVGRHLSSSLSAANSQLKLSSELMNARGTGYFQQNFTSTCTKPTCTFGEVTKEKLAMRKLASDVAKKVDGDFVDASSHLAYVSISGLYFRGYNNVGYHSGSLFTSNALDGSKVNQYKRLACELAKPFCVNSPLTSYVYGSREYQEQLCLAVMNSGENTLLGLRGRLCFATQPRL